MQFQDKVYVITGMNSGIGKACATLLLDKEATENILPIRQIDEPEDIAKVVLFLLSDISDYINRETIFTDGGFKISK